MIYTGHILRPFSVGDDFKNFVCCNGHKFWIKILLSVYPRQCIAIDAKCLVGVVLHSTQIDDTAIDNMTRSSGRIEHQYNTEPGVGNILANPSPLLHKWKANGYVIVCQMFLICVPVDERTPGCHQWITIQHAGSNFNCSLLGVTLITVCCYRYTNFHSFFISAPGNIIAGKKERKSEWLGFFSILIDSTWNNAQGLPLCVLFEPSCQSRITSLCSELKYSSYIFNLIES